jgi:uroporphyrinogen decarboxylase
MAWPYAKMTGISAIGFDWTYDRESMAEDFQPQLPVQGNVDPLALLAGGAALDREVDEVMTMLAGGPLIFNLGHGILPETPVDNVKNLARFVQEYSPRTA